VLHSIDNKIKRIRIGVVAIFLVAISPFSALAQSQDDINPDFDLSSEESAFIRLNYDCSGIPWPEGAVSVYRRFNPQTNQVENYFIKKDESIVQLEATNGFSAANRLPPPYMYTHPSGEKEVRCSWDGRTFKAVSVPPTLQQVENYFLDAVYIFWAFIGIYAVFRAIALGFEYMTNATAPERLGEVVSKLRWWLLAVVLAALAVPLLHYIYRIVGVQSTRCYYLDDGNEVIYDLTVPGFTFFFKDVCTDGERLGVTPVTPTTNCDDIPPGPGRDQCLEWERNN
jgi:hypothetical protein